MFIFSKRHVIFLVIRKVLFYTHIKYYCVSAKSSKNCSKYSSDNAQFVYLLVCPTPSKRGVVPPDGAPRHSRSSVGPMVAPPGRAVCCDDQQRYPPKRQPGFASGNHFLKIKNCCVFFRPDHVAGRPVEAPQGD